MKLVAKIERVDSKNVGRRPALKCVFPAERKVPFMYEHVLARNLGPRPYSEAFFVNASGERVVIYAK